MRLLLNIRGAALVFLGSVVALHFQQIAIAEPTDERRVVVIGQKTSSDGRPNFDLAKLQARARVVYVSSGANAFGARSIDDDERSVYRFSANDLHPTLVIELAQSEPLHRATAVFDAEANTKLQVCLLSSLPTHMGDLDHAKGVDCPVERKDLARAAVDFAPNDARYVVFRWSRSALTGAPFVVAEVSAFSTVSAAYTSLMVAQTEMHLARETGQDLSNTLGALADPPGITFTSP